MNETAIKLLEYDKVKERLAEYAITEQGKEVIRKLQPSIDIHTIRAWMNETTETRMIVDRSSSVPLNSLVGIDSVAGKLGKGGILQPEELTSISGLLESVRRLKKYMSGMQGIAPAVSSYAFSMYELEDLSIEIDRCIRYDSIDDKASPELSKVRKKIAIADERIKQRLESILKSPAYSGCIQDAVVSMRNGRYVIPVKKEYRKNIDGNVLDTSSSGSTLFIEPAGVKKLQEELNILNIEEENEVYKILVYLTGMIESYQREITINIEAIVHYDFLFAKAKYSKALECSPVELNTNGHIRIMGGKHPLIGRSAVPLDFIIGDKYRTLVITGPNTGGKTVALKTVGLLTMMAQSGMHVSADSDSELAVFKDILADIGDGQSIEQSLSTFSSHMRNISSIIECADPYSLVIIDELGAGTDPGEGMGLAIAVMEEIYTKGATTLATTHYSEIKVYADKKEGFENGCMEFDINTLKPLYRLKIGEAGESNAFLIALRLGIKREIIERAHEVTYREKKDYINVYRDLTVATIANTETIQSHMQKIEGLKKMQETRQKVERQQVKHSFQMGDCVYISSMDRTGIVCELENNKGEVGIMVMKKKLKINKKRLSIYIEGKELYPENYDFDIVFESKDNRKKRHVMDRKHVDGLVIETSG